MKKDSIYVIVTFGIIAVASVGGFFAYTKQQTSLEAAARLEEARALQVLEDASVAAEQSVSVGGADVLLEVESSSTVPVAVEDQPTAAELKAQADAELQAQADAEAAQADVAAWVAEQERLQLQAQADEEAARIAAEELAAQIAAEEAAALAEEQAAAKKKSRRSEAS